MTEQPKDPNVPEKTAAEDNITRSIPSDPTDFSSTAGGNPVEGSQIMLVIDGVPIRILLQDNTRLTMGRPDPAKGFTPHIDLTRFNAEARGVSRMHATLTFRDKRLYLTDQTSRNGTFVAGQRLKPNEPRMLRVGDVIALGRLVIVVELP
jgi:pSer/pThr/pTyr-binding forkhead associated (FHA) protein